MLTAGSQDLSGLTDPVSGDSNSNQDEQVSSHDPFLKLSSLMEQFEKSNTHHNSSPHTVKKLQQLISSTQLNLSIMKLQCDKNKLFSELKAQQANKSILLEQVEQLSEKEQLFQKDINDFFEKINGDTFSEKSVQSSIDQGLASFSEMLTDDSLSNSVKKLANDLVVLFTHISKISRSIEELVVKKSELEDTLFPSGNENNIVQDLLKFQETLSFFEPTISADETCSVSQIIDNLHLIIESGKSKYVSLAKNKEQNALNNKKWSTSITNLQNQLLSMSESKKQLSARNAELEQAICDNDLSALIKDNKISQLEGDLEVANEENKSMKDVVHQKVSAYEALKVMYDNLVTSNKEKDSVIENYAEQVKNLTSQKWSTCSAEFDELKNQLLQVESTSSSTISLLNENITSLTAEKINLLQLNNTLEVEKKDILESSEKAIALKDIAINEKIELLSQNKAMLNELESKVEKLTTEGSLEMSIVKAEVERLSGLLGEANKNISLFEDQRRSLEQKVTEEFLVKEQVLNQQIETLNAGNLELSTSLEESKQNQALLSLERDTLKSELDGYAVKLNQLEHTISSSSSSEEKYSLLFTEKEIIQKQFDESVLRIAALENSMQNNAYLNSQILELSNQNQNLIITVAEEKKKNSVAAEEFERVSKEAMKVAELNSQILVLSNERTDLASLLEKEIEHSNDLKSQLETALTNAAGSSKAEELDSQIVSLSASLEEEVRKSTDLESKLDTALTNSTHLEKSIKSLTIKLTSLQDEKKILESSLEQEKGKYALLFKDTSGLISEFTEFKNKSAQENQTLVNENKELVSKNNELVLVKSGLEDELMSVYLKVEDLQITIEDFQIRESSASSKHLSLQQQQQELEKDLEKHATLATSLSLENGQLKTKLEEASTNFSQLESRVQSNECLNSQILELSNDNQKLRNTIDELRKTISDLEAAANSINLADPKELEELKVQVEQVNAKYTHLENEYSSLQNNFNNVSSSHEELQACHSELKDKSNSLEQVISTNEKSISVLNEKLELAQTEINSLLLERDQLKVEHDLLEVAREELTGKLEILASESTSLMSEREELKQKFEESSAELKVKEAQSSSVSAERDEYKEKCLLLEVVVKDLNDKIEFAQVESNSLSTERNQLKEEVNLLEAAKVALKERLEFLQIESASILTERDQIEEKCHLLEASNAVLGEKKLAGETLNKQLSELNDIHFTLNESFNTLSQNHSSLQTKLEELEDSVLKKDSQIKELQESNSSDKLLKASLESINEQMFTEISEKADKISRIEHELETLTLKANATIESLSNVENQLGSELELKKELETQFANASVELQTLKESLSKVEMERDALSTEHENSCIVIERLSEELAKSKEKVQSTEISLNEKISALSKVEESIKEYQSNEEEFSTQISSLESLLNTANSKVTAIEQERDMLFIKVENSEIDIGKAKEELEMAYKNLEKATSSLAANKSEFVILENSLKELRSEKVEYSSLIASLEKEIEVLKMENSTIASLEQGIAELNKQNIEWKEAHNNLSLEKTQMEEAKEKQLICQSQEIETWKQEVQKREESLRQFKDLEDKANIEVKRLQEELESLNGRHDELKLKIEEMENSLEINAEELAKKNELINSSTEDIRKLKEAANATACIIQENESIIESLKLESQQKEKERSRLEDDNSNYVQEIKSYENKFNELNKSVEAKNAALSKMENEFEVSRADLHEKFVNINALLTEKKQQLEDSDKVRESSESARIQAENSLDSLKKDLASKKQDILLLESELEKSKEIIKQTKITGEKRIAALRQNGSMDHAVIETLESEKLLGKDFVKESPQVLIKPSKSSLSINLSVPSASPTTTKQPEPDFSKPVSTPYTKVKKSSSRKSSPLVKEEAIKDNGKLQGNSPSSLGKRKGMTDQEPSKKVKPSPLNDKNNKKFYITFSGFKDGTQFDAARKARLISMVKRMPNAEYVGGSDDFDPRITHVVSPIRTRTLKTFAASLTGKWFIYDAAWIENSAKDGSWLPETQYGETFANKPFEGKKFFMADSFHSEEKKGPRKSLYEKYVRTLIVTCGNGIITNDEKDADFTLRGSKDAKSYGPTHIDWQGFVNMISQPKPF